MDWVKRRESNIASGRHRQIKTVSMWLVLHWSICAQLSRRDLYQLLNIANSSCSHNGYTFKGERGSERTRDLCVFLWLCVWFMASRRCVLCHIFLLVINSKLFFTAAHHKYILWLTWPALSPLKYPMTECAQTSEAYTAAINRQALHWDHFFKLIVHWVSHWFDVMCTFAYFCLHSCALMFCFTCW